MDCHILLVTTSCWSSHRKCFIQTSQWWELRTQRSILGTFLPVLGRPELCLLLELMWFSASLSSWRNWEGGEGILLMGLPRFSETGTMGLYYTGELGGNWPRAEETLTMSPQEGR